MYKLRNKQTGVEVFALGFTKESTFKSTIQDYADKIEIWNSLRTPKKLTAIWNEFLSNVEHELEDRNWKVVIKIYEGVIVNEGDWVIRNQEGFYFPIHYKLLTKLYDFVGTKPDDFWDKYK